MRAPVDKGVRTVVPVDGRTSYPTSLPGAMLGRLNVGAGPFEIDVDQPRPWLFEDPRASAQSIIVFVAHNDEAGETLAAGFWYTVDEATGVIMLNCAGNAPNKLMVLSYAVIG